MTGSSTEVVQTGGLIVYSQPYASGNSMPTDSAWATAWGGSWVDKGFTQDGLNVNIGVDYTDVTVDQSVYALYTIGTAGDMHLVTNLAQLTMANLKEALGGNGTVSTVNAISGTRGHVDLALFGDVTVNFLTAGYDIYHPGDLEALRYVIWKGQARAAQQMSFQRTNKALVAYDVQAYIDTANSNRMLTARDVIPALP